MKWINALQQPFPCYTTAGSKLRMAAYFGFFIFLFLFVFKPFELDNISTGKLFLIVLAYGCITFVCVALTTILLPKIFPDWFEESKWTTGRQIVFSLATVVLVGLVNYFFSPMLVDTKLNWRDAIWFQGITLALGLIPISIFFLIRQNQLLKTYREKAEVIEKKLQEKAVPVNIQPVERVEAPVVLTGDYQQEKVEVDPDNLYLVTSASNYIKIYHHQKGKLTYSIIRSTLKKAEESLSAHNNFFKCHRAYIVNLDKVAHVEGNAQGYRLTILDHEEPVPVSRNLNAEFSDRLLAYRKM